MNHPFVSVIIPTQTIGYYLIFETLPALNRQTYKHFEVIVLPNHKGTYDTQLLKKYQWLKIIETESIRLPAAKRNRGVAKAKGNIIAFIDDDAYPDKHWIKNAIAVWEKNNVAVVCGPGILPQTSHFWEKVFHAVLTSWVGSGLYTYRFQKERKRYVDDYPSVNFFVSKQMFENLKGFRKNYWPGEDSKLCNDIVYKKCKKILYHPEVVVYHHKKNTLKAFLSQHARYGFHRGLFFIQGDKNSRKIEYVFPSLFLWYLAGLFVSLFILRPFFLILLIPLSLYFLVLLLSSLSIFISLRHIGICLLSLITFFLMHIIYGAQFIHGYVKGKRLFYL